ncbi:MAG: hypothetical protein ABI615_03850 [Chthoniobacterales bacterium]
MKKQILLGCFLLCLACGCAQKSSNSTADSSQTGTTQQSTISKDEQEAEKVAKVGAHVVIGKVAGTPLKVISAVGGAANAVKNKVTGEDNDEASGE